MNIALTLCLCLFLSASGIKSRASCMGCKQSVAKLRPKPAPLFNLERSNMLVISPRRSRSIIREKDKKGAAGPGWQDCTLYDKIAQCATFLIALLCSPIPSLKVLCTTEYSGWDSEVTSSHLLRCQPLKYTHFLPANIVSWGLMSRCWACGHGNCIKHVWIYLLKSGSWNQVI